MHRDSESHKGENGKVAIIGGSALIHGAPLFSALAAEASGVDLLFVCVPRVHSEVARETSLNFQVHPFAGDELQKKDLEPLLELLATMDSVVIGPGLSRESAPLAALKELISEATCPLVLDASALQPWTLKAIAGKPAVVTPHLGELERMSIGIEDLAHVSEQAGLTIHCKGPIDRIASAGEVTENPGGNAGLTVGGTGDALAGLIAGLLAQKMTPKEACLLASTVIKRAGVILSETQGHAYTTRQVIGEIPKILRCSFP